MCFLERGLLNVDSALSKGEYALLLYSNMWNRNKKITIMSRFHIDEESPTSIRTTERAS